MVIHHLTMVDTAAHIPIHMLPAMDTATRIPPMPAPMAMAAMVTAGRRLGHVI